MDFYPRPLRGGRRCNGVRWKQSTQFLSTPSARRATCQPRPGSRPDQFLSTPSARRATALVVADAGDVPISIHALCEEGDPGDRRAHDPRAISIHALCEEGDTMKEVSTISKRNFYPRPLRGGRQQKQRQNLYFQTNYTTFCTNLEEP